MQHSATDPQGSRQGRVVAIDVTSDGRQATVEVDKEAVCERCASGKGCGAGLFAGRSRSRQLVAAIASDLDIARGDIVRISMRPAKLLLAALIVYGYPLVAALIAAGIAFSFALSDLGALLLVAIGAASGYWLARIALRGQQCVAMFVPVISEKLTSVSTPV